MYYWYFDLIYLEQVLSKSFSLFERHTAQIRRECIQKMPGAKTKRATRTRIRMMDTIKVSDIEAGIAVEDHLRELSTAVATTTPHLALATLLPWRTLNRWVSVKKKKRNITIGAILFIQDISWVFSRPSGTNFWPFLKLGQLGQPDRTPLEAWAMHHGTR